MVRSHAFALALVAVLVAGALLRFWRIDVPPSWLDESVTALIAAGRGPDALPLGSIVPLAQVGDMFDGRTTATFADALAVFHDPRVQDLHPPTYHLLSNAVLRSGLWGRSALVVRVRALAALIGVLAIAMIYVVAAQAFDRQTALAASALTAVSPYAVMLSREARNYSFAMLMVAASMTAALAVVRRIEESRPTARLWIAWAGLSACSFYVHYFTIFAFAAQAAVLAYTAARMRSTWSLLSLAGACLAVVAAFLPWLPTLVAQQGSPEQRWLTFAIYGSSPLDVPYRIASAWQTMLLGKAWNLPEPVHDITRALALVLYLAILAAVGWTLWRTSDRNAEDRAARLALAIAVLTMVEYIVAMALQRKDFVSEVRYQYAYYVPVVVVVGWVFARRLHPAAIVVLLAAGAINSAMVDLDIESWKGTDPPPVLARLDEAPRPTLIVGGSGSFNETVVYATILNEWIRRSGAGDREVAIVQRTPLYASFDIHANPTAFWDAFSRLRPDVLPSSVMVHSSGMTPAEYKPTVVVTSTSGASVTCTGVALDDPALAGDNTLIRPLYRRYTCGAAAAAPAH